MRHKIYPAILAMLIVAFTSLTDSHGQTPPTPPAPPAKTAEESPLRTAEAPANTASAPSFREAADALVNTTATAADPQAAASPQNAAASGSNKDPKDQIIPAPILLSYREVKDNFGKRIADTYVVVQVSIKNSNLEHQFLLQDLRVVFDPRECAKAGDFFKRFDVADCEEKYNKYLKYPIAYASVAQPALQAVAEIGQFHNPRNFAFRLLDFAANMGGALTGFNFIGRDGKAGLSVFNGTFLTASKTFIPDLTAGQVTRLTEQSYKPNSLVESKETKTFNAFIPTNQLFTKENWKLYKQTVGNGSAESVEMLRLLQMVLTAEASGTHVQQVDSETTRGGGAPERDEPR